MSFFINNQNQNRPCALSNNPTAGLCEKMLIEVTRVFDACMNTITEQGLSLTVADYVPANPTFPLTFISAESTEGTTPTVSNVVITRLETRPNFANVSGTVSFPVTVNYRDANGILGSATTTYTNDFSSVLFVPQPALTPIEVKVAGQFSSQLGSFTSDTTVSLTGCIQLIVKVTAVVDILVPSYGYPFIPPCQSFPNECPGTFDLPIYPTQRGVPTNINLNTGR